MADESSRKEEEAIENPGQTSTDDTVEENGAEDESAKAVVESVSTSAVKRSRLLIRVVALIAIAALAIAAARFVRNRIIMTPLTDPVGTIVSTSGQVTLYMHDDLVTDRVKVPFTLYEGHRVETGEGASAVLMGGLPVSDPERSAIIHLRENSRIMSVIPPTIQIEKGAIAVHVPEGCMGFSVDLRDTEERDIVRCGSMQGDFVVTREARRLRVQSYAGEVRISNVTDGADVPAGHHSIMELGGIPTEPEEMEDMVTPEELAPEPE